MKIYPPEWKISLSPVAYPEAVEAMERRVSAVLSGSEPEQVWLLEHPPLYTVGTSGKESDILDNGRFPIYPSGRGGQITYHGPGQRIGYVMLDLKRRNMQDVRAYVQALEQWIIATLKHFGIEGCIREGRVGVWGVDPKQGEAKIAALGIRLKQWVSYHGISLNVDPDLTHYSGIVPCGISEYGVTSLAALGINAPMQEVDEVLKKEFKTIFT